MVTVVGGSELARQQSKAPRRLHAEDATGRAVRHPVRKSQAGAPDDAQVRTVRRRVQVPDRPPPARAKDAQRLLGTWGAATALEHNHAASGLAAL